MNFGKILKSLLDERNVSQLGLAISIGYTQRAVSKWVNEQSEPSETAIKKTAEFFNVSTDYLLGRSDELGGALLPAPTSTPNFNADEDHLIKNFRAMRPDLKAYLLQVSDTFVQTPQTLAENTKTKKDKRI